MRFTYPARLRHDSTGEFIVSFRDLPECLTSGATVPDALAEAADVLEEAIAGRIDDAEAIPVPSARRSGEHHVAVPAGTAAKAAHFRNGAGTRHRSCTGPTFAGSQMHRDDSEMSALGRVSDPLVSIPILLRQRRSVGCITYPSHQNRISGHPPIESNDRDSVGNQSGDYLASEDFAEQFPGCPELSSRIILSRIILQPSAHDCRRILAGAM